MAHMTGSGPTSEWRQNWTVVLAGAMGMALASLAPYGLGIFVEPIQDEFGWKRAQISGAMTVLSVLGVVFGPFVGLLVDRVGPRRIGMVGVIGYCAGFAGLSLAGPAIWTWYALWVPFAIAGLLIKPTVWTSGVSSLFVKGRGLALSLTLCGTALCSTLTPIVGNAMIKAWGWREALVGLGLFWAVLVVPPVLLFFSSAKDQRRSSPPSDVTAPVLTGLGFRDGLLTWKYFRLAAAGFLASIFLVSFTTTLVPILTSLEITRDNAANVAGLLGFSTIFGRIGGGYLLDRVKNGNVVGAASLLLPIVPCLMLLHWPGDVTIAIGATLILGLSMGAELDAVAYLTARHFGMKNYGLLFGTISGLLALATGLGPLFVNLVYDATDSYVPALWAYVPLGLITACLFISLGSYPKLEEKAE